VVLILVSLVIATSHSIPPNEWPEHPTFSKSSFPLNGQSAKLFFSAAQFRS